MFFFVVDLDKKSRIAELERKGGDCRSKVCEQERVRFSEQVESFT